MGCTCMHVYMPVCRYKDRWTVKEGKRREGRGEEEKRENGEGEGEEEGEGKGGRYSLYSP